MTTTKTRRGRKEKPYQLADGSYVNGLRRRANDGRWVVISTGQMFTEPDEAKAIRKFNKLKGVAEPVNFDGHRARRDKQWFLWVGQQLRTRPKWVAEQMEVPELEHYRDFKPPEKLPTLEQIKDAWTIHKRCSKDQKQKVLTYWKEFVEFTKIGGINHITAQMAVDYQDYIYTEEYAPKTQSHFFNGIRGILHFAKSRAMAIEAMGRAIDALKLMRPSDPIGNNKPKPVSVAHFHAMLEVVQGDDRAMLLMMLNCALYCGEVVTVQWDEIDESNLYSSHRQKKGKHPRFATLWPETVEALKDVERKGPSVFRSNQGKQLSKFTAFERFRNWRDDAKLSNKTPLVTPSHLRDGAYSAAVNAGISLPICQMLAGHFTGQSVDNYVLGSGKAVKPACDAVYKHYFS